jgi:hypothetical protein
MGLDGNTNITSMKNIRQANKGLTYLKDQEKRNTEEVKLKKYYLSQIVKKPSFFSNNNEVYNLYLTVFLENGRPLWLENDNFIFHTSSNKKYLQKMQKIYAKKYKINLTLNKNTQYWKSKFKLRKINIDNFAKYMNEKVSFSLEKKSTHKKNKMPVSNVNKKNTPINLALVQTKKEVLLVEKASKYLYEEKNNTSVKLRKYILYKNVKKPTIFQSDKPIYNLYLTGILNGGKPKWLADNRFIFHTGTNINYLKRLQKKYKKKYNLELSLSKLADYKNQKFILMPVKQENILEYIKENIPLKYKMKTFSKKSPKPKNKFADKHNKNKKEHAKIIRLSEKKRNKKSKTKQNTIKIKANRVNAKNIEKKKKEKRKLEEANRRETESKQKVLEEERKKIATEKRKLLKERKVLEEQKKALNKEKLAMSAQKEANRKTLEEKKKKDKAEKIRIQKEKEYKLKKEAERKTLEEKKKKDKAEKIRIQKEKERKLKKEAERKILEEKKKKDKADKIRIQKEKEHKLKKEAEKKKKDDTLTSDIDAMLKETTEYKEKLERSESIKYY